MAWTLGISKAEKSVHCNPSSEVRILSWLASQGSSPDSSARRNPRFRNPLPQGKSLTLIRSAGIAAVTVSRLPSLSAGTPARPSSLSGSARESSGVVSSSSSDVEGSSGPLAASTSVAGSGSSGWVVAVGGSGWAVVVGAGSGSSGWVVAVGGSGWAVVVGGFGFVGLGGGRGRVWLGAGSGSSGWVVAVGGSGWAVVVGAGSGVGLGGRGRVWLGCWVGWAVLVVDAGSPMAGLASSSDEVEQPKVASASNSSPVAAAPARSLRRARRTATAVSRRLGQVADHLFVTSRIGTGRFPSLSNDARDDPYVAAESSSAEGRLAVVVPIGPARLVRLNGRPMMETDCHVDTIPGHGPRLCRIAC